MEADEIDVASAAMLGDFEQVKDAKKTGSAGQFRCDVGEADRLDGIDFDLPFFHAIASTCLDVGTLPDADARGDVSTTNAVAEALGEYHEESLRGQRAGSSGQREWAKSCPFEETIGRPKTGTSVQIDLLWGTIRSSGSTNAAVVESVWLAASGRRWAL